MNYFKFSHFHPAGIIALLILSGCSIQKEDDWFNEWPTQEVPENLTPIKGLSGEKHHF